MQKILPFPKNYIHKNDLFIRKHEYIVGKNIEICQKVFFYYLLNYLCLIMSMQINVFCDIKT